jgi:predicted dehydrogenase
MYVEEKRHATKRLNGAIVGLGRMGLTHLAILKTHPAIVQLSLVDSSSCLGRAIEKQLGLPFYQEVEELLEKARPDFMIIATPTNLHSEMTSAAVRKGVHVFVEKPLSLSVKESTHLVELAAAQGVIAQVGYVNRFNEIFQAVRALIQSGDLGHVTHVSCEIRSPMIAKTSNTGWRSKLAGGGGCLCDIASHGVDLLNFLVGPPKEVIGGSLQSVVSKGVDDYVDALFAYEGFRGTIHVNWSDASCRKPAYRINIDASEGRVIADQHAYKVFQGALAGRRPNIWKTVYITEIAQPVRLYVRGNEYTRQLDYFIDSIVQKRTMGISGFEAAMETDRVIEEIRKADARVRAI